MFALDVGSEESIKECVKAVIAQLGKVEILVNNAGITRDILALRMKRKDWDDVLTTNLTGAFLMTQAVMGSMLKGRWGQGDQYYVGGGGDGAGGAGELCGVEGGADRADQVAGAGAGEPDDYGECGGAGIYRDGDDGGADGGAEDGDDLADSAGARGDGPGYCGGGGVSGVGGGGVYYRARAGCEWRDVYGVGSCEF